MWIGAEKRYLWVAKIWSKCSLFFFGIRVTIKGAEHIQRDQNYVYAANHSSYMDIPILLGYVPDNLRLTLRSSLTRIPIWGWALLVRPFLVLDRTNPAKAQRTIGKAIERIRAWRIRAFFSGRNKNAIREPCNRSNVAHFI